MLLFAVLLLQLLFLKYLLFKAHKQHNGCCFIRFHGYLTVHGGGANLIFLKYLSIRPTFKSSLLFSLVSLNNREASIILAFGWESCNLVAGLETLLTSTLGPLNIC